MALITDYASLSQSVADYLAKSNLTTFIPNFIQNCEGKLYRTLRIRAMESALSVVITAGVATIPATFRALKYAYLATSPITPLEYKGPEEIYSRFPNRTGSGVPELISYEGSNFIFGPFTSATYTVNGMYWGRLPSLSASNTTNWFIANAPEILLYGALLEAQPFIMNDSRIAVWSAAYEDAKQTIINDEKTANRSSGLVAIRPG